ncbi:MAG: VCBS repeat-containing protein, partial [Acidobacteria bacterium]|nr:VCBS repeat-containing protein [Acidobacteriota bacterium]
MHFNGRSGDLLLAEITCGGGAVLDFDGDGDLDLYLLQGRMLRPGKTVADSPVPAAYPPPLTDRLYRNEIAEHGQLGWKDVTAGLGADTSRYGCAAATGDYDGDGRPDLYLANLGVNQLLQNLGGGRFEDVTLVAGVGDGGSGVVALFADFDGDGHLDLFVGNNMAFDLTGSVICRSLTGAKDYCGPGAYPSQPDRLYRNRGDGSFEDVTASSGLGAAPSLPTLGAVAGDFNGDGREDLYVANDGQPNRLWINLGDGRFEDQGLLSGSAVNGRGAAEASMGVAAGDYDGDGDPDIFSAHLVKETSTLYRNEGGGQFRDLTAESRLGSPSLPFTAFGTGWLDYDNDGWLDLLVVNGAVTLVPELVEAGDPFPLHQRNQLFHNQGSGREGVFFREVPANNFRSA